MYVCVLASGTATFTSLRVANAEGELSGVYTLDGSGNYIKHVLSIQYGFRYWYDDQWYVEQMNDGTSYPQYFVRAININCPGGIMSLW